MAALELRDGRLHVELTPLERVFAMRASFEVDAALIESVVEVPNAWPEIHGVRWPGTGLPDIVCFGTLRHHGERDFSIVYGRGPTTIITLRDSEYRRLLISGSFDVTPLLQ